MEGARRARPDEVGDLSALEERGRRLLADQRGGALHLQHRPTHDFGSDIEDPAQLVIVGTIDEVSVGYAAVASHDLPRGLPIAELTDLFVLPEARGVGVGAAMFDVALRWARDAGCQGIDATALPGDRTTKSFLEAHAMVARSIRMHRSIQPDTP